MSRRKRVIIAVIVLEVLFGLGWVWLSHSAGYTKPEAQRAIGEVFGMAMGILLGISPLLYLFARSNDRRAEQRAGKP